MEKQRLYKRGLNRKLLEMLAFFKDSKVYMLGDFNINAYILRFLSHNGINIEGYIVQRFIEKIGLMQHCEYKFSYPIFVIDELSTLDGVKIAVHMNYHDSALLEVIRSKGAKDIFFVEEDICRRCFEKFHPRNSDSVTLEIDVADHCNLSCFSCNRYSQLAKPGFLDPDEYMRDMRRFSELAGGVLRKILLMGGEPLLHPRLDKIIDISRECFPHAFIEIITNGILLPAAENAEYGNLYEICANKNVCICLSDYPLKLNTDLIRKIAHKYNTIYWSRMEQEQFRLSLRDDSLLFEKNTLDFTKSQNPSISASSCYFANFCFSLKHGKLATCPAILNIDHFNEYFGTNLKATHDDYIDIYEAKNFYELAEFMAKPVPFCGYCDHRDRPFEEWKMSTRTIDEYL
jgi:hypothetical protein